MSGDFSNLVLVQGFYDLHKLSFFALNSIGIIFLFGNSNSLIDLEDFFEERKRYLDVELKDVWPGLVADLEEVSKPLSNQQGASRALLL